jgi:hypothetical protein
LGLRVDLLDEAEDAVVDAGQITSGRSDVTDDEIEEIVTEEVVADDISEFDDDMIMEDIDELEAIKEEA